MMAHGLTPDDEQCLKLGRLMVRMIRDLEKVSNGEIGYARRVITFPGGEAHVLLANHKSVADVMDNSARQVYEIVRAIPPAEGSC